MRIDVARETHLQTLADTTELTNALRRLRKHPDAEWGPRAVEEATLRTPDGADRLLARYVGHPDAQKRVIYRALSLAGDHHAAAQTTRSNR